MNDRFKRDTAANEMRPRERRGFVLPMVILVIAILSATVAAGFTAVTAELATNGAQRSEARVFAIAQSGLEDFLARRPTLCLQAGSVCGSMPTAAVESVKVALPGGYAWVVSTRVLASTATRPAYYLVRSRGVDTMSAFNGRTVGVAAERIVAQYVRWSTQSIQVLAGWTSLTGLLKTGNSGTLGGADHCSVANGGSGTTLAGVAVPTGGMTGSGSGVPTGSPPVLNMGTQTQANDAVKIDWAGIVLGGAVTADYTFAYNAAVPAALTTAWNDTTQYPVVHITGNGTFSPPAGRGMLIVDGDVDMGHGGWKGVILAGGNVTSNGTLNVYGAIMSGLNKKLTPAQLTAAGLVTPAGGDVGHGTKDIEYDSCYVSKAASRFGFYIVLPNAWMDNFTTY